MAGCGSKEKTGCCSCTFEGSSCSASSFANQAQTQDSCATFCNSEAARVDCPLSKAELSSCAAPTGDGDREANISYLADSSSICQHAGDCGRSQSLCESEWPTVDQINDALSTAAVSDAELDDCTRQARAVDQCLLSLSCDQFENAQTECETSFTAYDAACDWLNEYLDENGTLQ
jgi:hypothetical protein